MHSSKSFKNIILTTANNSSFWGSKNIQDIQLKKQRKKPKTLKLCSKKCKRIVTDQFIFDSKLNDPFVWKPATSSAYELCDYSKGLGRLKVEPHLDSMAVG